MARRSIWGLVFVLAASVGCGGAVMPSGGGGGGGGGGNGSGGGGGGNGNGNGSSYGGGGNTGVSGLPTCATASHVAERQPPTILLLVDASASMGFGLPGGDSRWTAAAKAITSILDESPDEYRFGLRTFPSARGIGGTKCQAPSYEQLQVDIGPRKQTRQPIACHVGTAVGCSGISPVELILGTPINAALRGAAERMSKEQSAGARVIVLVSDGEPVGCAPNTVGDIIATAEAGFKQHQIRTYVMSVDTTSLFAAPRNINGSRIAAAGGGKRADNCDPGSPDATTSCSYHISDANFRKDMEKALRDVAGRSLGCVFKVPSGANSDPDKVNVVFERDGKRIVVPRDAARKNGWDYEDGGNSVRLYGGVCDAVTAEAKAGVTIEVGCKTERVL
ncbi:MAG: hypothetical protein KC503_24550 [Myxococcales bacterium]|nr:hypothetical protein [Myxococcales bacterium]